MSNSQLIQQYTKASEWVDAKPKRERVLLGLCLLAVVFLLWNYGIQLSFEKRSQELNTQLVQLENDRKTNQGQLTSLITAFSNDPAKVKQDKIIQLQQMLRDVEEKLSGVSQGLIAAENLPQILESVFYQTQGLELIQLKTLPAEEMLIYEPTPVVNQQAQASSQSSVGSIPDISSKPVVNANANEARGTGVYKHGVVLHLRGDYFRVLALLKSMENLSWKFYWDSMNYTVKNYPTAEVELRVFTLSSEEGLLGV